ncbi:MAG TPA: prenyltransferase [Spirochaetia bacterium]|nr:prenyltransferase [Spirochaetia bacterium]
MKFNLSMWRKAVTVMPRIENDDWKGLDFISKWLISTRFAAIVMTIISVLIAGILAYRVGSVNLLIWLALMVSLIFAHATNNLVNDLVDYKTGIDRENYYRDQYGPQPLERGFKTMAGQLVYAGINGAVALGLGIFLVFYRGGLTPYLLGFGAFFVLFYTFPLKYFALGELALLVVWGPLMIGGGYYVLTEVWSWEVVIASLPFALGVTATLLGKHIDKFELDKAKHVYTLPVVIGEAAARVLALVLVVLQFVIVAYLIIVGYFTPVLAIVALSIPSFVKNMVSMYRHPKPDGKPEWYPDDAWPLWFVGSAFVFTRRFGGLFIVGVLADTLIRRIFM